MKTALLMVCVATVAFGQSQDSLPLPGSGDVTLPLDEYNRLIDLAAKPVKPEAKPPMAYAVQRAVVKLEAKGETVLGTMQLDGDVLATGLTPVPLAYGVTVLDAQQRGKTLPLWQFSGAHSAILTGPAPFSITLQVGLPVTVEPGSASFSLPVPLAGTVRVALTIPGESTSVNVSPGLVTGRTSGNGQTTIEAILSPAGSPPSSPGPRAKPLRLPRRARSVFSPT